MSVDLLLFGLAVLGVGNWKCTQPTVLNLTESVRVR